MNNAPNGISHFGDLLDTCDDVAQFRLIEHQPFVKRFGNAGGFRLCKICLVRFKNQSRILAKGCGDMFQNCGAIRASGKFQKCLPGALGLLSGFVHGQSVKNAILFRVMNAS